MLAAGLAHAQTNVTIYGIADAGVEFLTNAGGDDDNVFRMSSGNLSGSRIGFRGTEDIGGGLKGVFLLENGFDIDTGALGQNGRLFGRQAYVGLQGDFGAITLGRQQNALYDVIIKYDPMAFASRYSALSHDPLFTGRADNAIKYTGNFGPVIATAFYSFGRNADGEVPGSTKVSRNVGAGVAYASGPFGVGFAYDQFQGNTVATAGDSARRMAVGGSYEMGPVKGFVGYRWLKDELVAAGTPNVRSNMYWVGASWDASPALKLTGVVYHTDRRDSGADPTSLVLSADYALSKRTDVYLTVGHARNKSGSNLGLNGFGSSIIAGENQSGVIAGVRHRF
ncbi:porin [Noviherbaspirillum aridicola]|uniref:Porin n=1 Tax=Noviherbaspirillum aridicola TaxID=2849687 RepID=A0ABQ4Q3J7_9BURK|nr:porin [Noviherbaspirillum aridicola]